jgi:bis(5'-nucleosidyl)-tetraphosphatase
MKSKAAGVVLFRRKEGGPITFLVLRNALHRTWGFPKGHLEPGEDDVTAMWRELREETGIESAALVADFRESFGYPVRGKDGRSVEKTVVYFLGESPTESVRLSREHDTAKWAAIGEAEELVAFENMRRVLRLAHERLTAAAGSPF